MRADTADRSRSLRIETAKQRRQRLVKNRRQLERYNRKHREVRASFAPLVAAGLAKCARCGELIEPGSLWDMGHDDRDPSIYSGPEHAGCNRGAPHRNSVSRDW
jgi:hypothetical protein